MATSILLDFDPRGQKIDIAQGSTVFLTTKLSTVSGGGDSSGGVGSGAVSRYELWVEAAHDGPELKAELEDRVNSDDFSVEIEDFAVGTYPLNVGGADRGTIDVVAVQGGTEGEIEFRDPAGARPLHARFRSARPDRRDPQERRLCSRPARSRPNPRAGAVAETAVAMAAPVAAAMTIRPATTTAVAVAAAMTIRRAMTTAATTTAAMTTAVNAAADTVDDFRSGRNVGAGSG